MWATLAPEASYHKNVINNNDDSLYTPGERGGVSGEGVTMKKPATGNAFPTAVLNPVELKKRHITSSIAGVLIAGVVLWVGCSGNIVLRSISSTSADKHDCTTTQFDQTVTPFILDTLQRGRLRQSETFKVQSNYGSMNKFITLFRSNRGNTAKPYMFLFHFTDRLEDLRSDTVVTFDLGTDSLVLPLFTDPASTIISSTADRFLYAFLSDPQIRVLVAAETVAGYIGMVDFALPYSCRALWRNVIVD